MAFVPGCSICRCSLFSTPDLPPLKEGQPPPPPLPSSVNAMVTPCGHSFHAACIVQWTTSGHANSGTCPNCRDDIYSGAYCYNLFLEVCDEPIQVPADHPQLVALKQQLDAALPNIVQETSSVDLADRKVNELPEAIDRKRNLDALREETHRKEVDTLNKEIQTLKNARYEEKHRDVRRRVEEELKHEEIVNNLKAELRKANDRAETAELELVGTKRKLVQAEESQADHDGMVKVFKFQKEAWQKNLEKGSEKILKLESKITRLEKNLEHARRNKPSLDETINISSDED